jgi:hypothetical protein
VKAMVLNPYDARSENLAGLSNSAQVTDSNINPTEWIDSTAKNSESDINTDEKEVNQSADEAIQSPKSTVCHQQTLLTEEENTEAAQSQADVSPSNSSYSITTPPPLINTSSEQLEQVQSPITNMPTLIKFSTVQSNTDDMSHFRNRSSSSRTSYSSNNDQAIRYYHVSFGFFFKLNGPHFSTKTYLCKKCLYSTHKCTIKKSGIKDGLRHSNPKNLKSFWD